MRGSLHSSNATRGLDWRAPSWLCCHVWAGAIRSKATAMSLTPLPLIPPDCRQIIKGLLASNLTTLAEVREAG